MPTHPVTLAQRERIIIIIVAVCGRASIWFSDGRTRAQISRGCKTVRAMNAAFDAVYGYFLDGHTSSNNSLFLLLSFVKTLILDHLLFVFVIIVKFALLTAYLNLFSSFHLPF